MLEHMGSISPSVPERRSSYERSAEAEYGSKVTAFVRDIIYDERRLSAEDIERSLEEARRAPRLGSIEAERRELEMLSNLLVANAAHESANGFEQSSWGSHVAAACEDGVSGVARGEIRERFESYADREEQTGDEARAIEAYRKMLGLSPEFSIALSNFISIDRCDIEALLNDLLVRIAERDPDETNRRVALRTLDRELAEIARRIPDDQWGKRYELEESYLLRRLIHAADAGHLVSVSHGTLKEDLRRDFNSIDLRLDVAGDSVPLQVKTFKRGTYRGARDKQDAVIGEAQSRLDGSSTHLVVLWAEDVQEAFDRALRQPDERRTSRADKYAALEPIIGALDEDQRSRLLELTGMTEKDFAAERAASEAKQTEMNRLLEEAREKKRKEEERIAETEAERRREEEARMEEERARLETMRKREEELRAASEAKQAEIAGAVRTRQAAAEEALVEAARREEERKRREIEDAEARKKRDSRVSKLRSTLERKKEAGWPPKSLVKLAAPALLQAIGLLPENWKGDAPALLSAKKKFIAAFAKPKKGEATEQCQPNQLFKEAFPTKESLESPSAADIERCRAILNEALIQKAA